MKQQVNVLLDIDCKSGETVDAVRSNKKSLKLSTCIDTGTLQT